MATHNGMRFSTFDSDHDRSSVSCAQFYKGAWWYNTCYDANLNGMYLAGLHTSDGDGIEWGLWHGYKYSLKSSEMMIAKRY